VNVRISAATNRDLEKQVKEGLFREDLYFRLNVVAITLPSLSDRKNDIPLIANYFLNKFSDKMGLNVHEFDTAVLSILKEYTWPGNVRELSNIIQKTLIYSRGAPISKKHITSIIYESSSPTKNDSIKGNDKQSDPIHKHVRNKLTNSDRDNIHENLMHNFEKVILCEAMDLMDGNKTKVAQLLGLSRPTVQAKLEKYNLKTKTSVSENN
jgi:two-component system nitrogen regulation response regulator GlnG